MSSRSTGDQEHRQVRLPGDLGDVVGNGRAEGLQDHTSVRKGAEVGIVLCVDVGAQFRIPRLGHHDAHRPDDDPAAQQSEAHPLGQLGPGHVVEPGEPGGDRFGPLQRGFADRVDQDGGAEAARMRRQIMADHDGPEGVPQQVGLRAQFERAGQTVQEPGVALDVVTAGRQRFGFAEAGQIRGDHAVTGQLANYQFQPMVITAEAGGSSTGWARRRRARDTPNNAPTRRRAVPRAGVRVRPRRSRPASCRFHAFDFTDTTARRCAAGRCRRVGTAGGYGKAQPGRCRRVGTAGGCGKAQLTLPCAAG